MLVAVMVLMGTMQNTNELLAQEDNVSFGGIDTTGYDSLYIDRIFIVGNRKTRDRIIKRELDFTDHMAVSTEGLYMRLKRNEDNIINTRLFLSVNISLVKITGNEVDVIIRVTERWYTFPIPVLELADRNFHDWWVNQNQDLRRIEWGLKIYQYNVRGMNETLRLIGEFGFTKKFQIGYSFPYIDRKQKLGLSLLLGYSLNKNINYRTVEHKYQFFDSENWLREQYAGAASMTYRKSLYTFHTLGTGYYNTQVNDTIAILNPVYFSDGENQQKFFRLYYTYIHDKRDIKAYPLTGSYLTGKIDKVGLGIYDDVNVLGITGFYNKFFDLGKHFYLTGGVGGSLFLPEDQPYNQINAMGIGRFTLRGYELYVIEGPWFLQNQYTLRKMLFQTEQNLRDILNARQFSKFHLAVYLKTYFDYGYVKGYDGNVLNTKFTDQLIYGGGFGADVVTFYDIVFRLQYSINKSGESGFVFGMRSVF